METSVIVLIIVAVLIVTYARNMHKSWDEGGEIVEEREPSPFNNQEQTVQDPEQLSNDMPMLDTEEESYDAPMLDRVEESYNMPMLDTVESYKLTQYTPPVFTPTTGSFDIVQTEEKQIVYDYEEEEHTSHVNPIRNFDLRSAVIASEILKPKWEN